MYSSPAKSTVSWSQLYSACFDPTSVVLNVVPSTNLYVALCIPTAMPTVAHVCTYVCTYTHTVSIDVNHRVYYGKQPCSMYCMCGWLYCLCCGLSYAASETTAVGSPFSQLSNNDPLSFPQLLFVSGRRNHRTRSEAGFVLFLPDIPTYVTVSWQNKYT